MRHLNFRSILISLGMAGLALLWSCNIMAFSLFSSEPSTENTPLPKFSLPSLSSHKHLTNRAFLGQVSLLNVWASWCRYCHHEHPMLLTIRNNYHVPIYGLDYKDNPVNAESWLETNGNPYILSGIDMDGDLAENLQLSGTPETYIIDKHGSIRYRHVGGIDNSAWQYHIWPLIQKLRKEK